MIEINVRIKGVDIDRVQEIVNNDRVFYIDRLGSSPEHLNCFYYGNSEVQFCFYLTKKLENDTETVNVYHATSERNSGALHLDESELSHIQSDIECFFKNHDFYNIKKSRQELHNIQVIFTWNVAQINQ